MNGYCILPGNGPKLRNLYWLSNTRKTLLISAPPTARGKSILPAINQREPEVLNKYPKANEVKWATWLSPSRQKKPFISDGIIVSLCRNPLHFLSNYELLAFYNSTK
jgi:hypothetical protein